MPSALRLSVLMVGSAASGTERRMQGGANALLTRSAKEHVAALSKHRWGTMKRHGASSELRQSHYELAQRCCNVDELLQRG